MAHFEVYKDSEGKYRWRLKSSGNNKIIADSAESYWLQPDCVNGIDLVKQQAPTADIQYL